MKPITAGEAWLLAQMLLIGIGIGVAFATMLDVARHGTLRQIIIALITLGIVLLGAHRG